MGLVTSLTTVRDFLITNISDLTTDNCSVDDEIVFNYIQTTLDAPTKCVLVSPDTWIDDSTGEFASGMLQWTININGFFMQDEDDYMLSYNNANAFTDEVIQLVIRNPKLDGSVMNARLVNGGPPLAYERQNHWYTIAPITIIVTENIT